MCVDVRDWVQDEWLKDLESGEHAQARGAWSEIDDVSGAKKRCCLAVAGEITFPRLGIKADFNRPWKAGDEPGVTKKLGLVAAHLFGKTGEVCPTLGTSLTVLNDTYGLTFGKIANEVRRAAAERRRLGV